MMHRLEQRLEKLESQSPMKGLQLEAIEFWCVIPGTMQRRHHSTVYLATATELERTVIHDDGLLF